MTKRHTTTSCTQKSNFSDTRRLKVREGLRDYQQNQNPEQRTRVGLIELKGHWLVQAGFEVDQAVTVRVMDKCLVLTTHPKTKSIMDDFQQLKPKEKKLIRELIDELVN